MSTDYQKNTFLPRSPVSDVYDQIITDLEEAKNLLSPDYVGGDKVRVTQWAAFALLARAYLYTENWAKAEEYSNLIISSGLFTPLGMLSTIFSKNSKEAIWQLGQSGPFPPELLNGVYPIGGPQILLSDNLLAAFSSGDQRKLQWISSTNVGGCVVGRGPEESVGSGAVGD
jgi:hypothetical protein